jgi:hypothetical protein
MRAFYVRARLSVVPIKSLNFILPSGFSPRGICFSALLQRAHSTEAAYASPLRNSFQSSRIRCRSNVSTTAE